MPDTDILVSELNSASQINTTDLLLMTQPDGDAQTGYSSRKGTVLQVANKLLKDTEYTTDLPNFDNKSVFGALNEIRNGTYIYKENETPYQLRQTPITANRTLEKLIGVSCAFNQLVQNGNFEDISIWVKYQCNYAVNSNIASITVSNVSDGSLYQYVNCINGHKYLVNADLKNDSADECALRIDGSVASQVEMRSNLSQYVNKSTIISANDDNRFRFIVTGYGNNGQFNAKNCMVIDLTACFGSEVADYLYNLEQNTAGSGIALFRQLFPLDYYAYQTAHLESAKPTSKVVVGVNQFDKTNYVDNKVYGNGIEYSASGFAHSDFIPCFPNVSYYTSASAIGSYYTVDFFDKSKNYLSDNRYDLPNAGAGVFTTPANCYYMIVNTNKSQCSIDALCVNYPSTDHNYHAYEKHTYPLGGDELRGLLKVVDGQLVAYGDVKGSDGNGTEVFDIVDLSTLTWSYNSNGVCWITDEPISGIKYPDGNTMPNMICQYPSRSYGSTWSEDIISAYLSPYNGRLMINNGSTSIEPTGYLVYEKATPTAKSYTPFTNPMLCGSTEEFTDSRSLKMFCGHDSLYYTSNFKYW